LNEKADGKMFNTSVVFGPDGREAGRYRKIHIFDARLSRRPDAVRIEALSRRRPARVVSRSTA